MPDAGMFPGGNQNWLADRMESKPGVPAACVKAMETGKQDWRRCMDGSVTLQFTKTPMFVLNSLYNWCPAFFMLPAFAKNVSWISSVLPSYRKTLIQGLSAAWSSDTPHGVFADACDVHVESSVDWSKVSIGGPLMKDAAARWYFNRSIEKLL